MMSKEAQTIFKWCSNVLQMVSAQRSSTIETDECMVFEGLTTLCIAVIESS